ncbi:MAG: PhzF family phenazine biosynthesis protein [Pseudomonadota bacterium]
MNELPVAFKIEDELAWIGLPPIDCDACAMPTWVGEFISSVPWRAATEGASDGYLILEWPAGFDLEELTVPGAALAKRTKRSVIATCAAPDYPELDIMLRYFAPNHGVPEDTSTGSAMRVLASYWMRRELNGGLAAFQCSKRGGALVHDVVKLVKIKSRSRVGVKSDFTMPAHRRVRRNFVEVTRAATQLGEVQALHTGASGSQMPSWQERRLIR